MSSLDHPIYRKIQEKRRPLLQKYKIPYTVILNETESPMSDQSSPTLIPTRLDEILYPMGGSQPSMTMKFLNAAKQYFRSFPSFDAVPDYIVRINATVYIYFPEMLSMLEKAPRTNVVIGPVYGNSFICGMVMIFSKDVMMNILQDTRIFDKEFMDNADDVVLSELSRPYSDWETILPNFVYPDTENTTQEGIYRLGFIRPYENAKWYFRIRDLVHSDRRSDIDNWDILMEYFDESSSIENYAAQGHSVHAKTVAVFILGMAVCSTILLFCREKHKNHDHKKHRT